MLFLGADLSQRLVPDGLWGLVASLLPLFTPRRQGGGTAAVDERSVVLDELGVRGELAVAIRDLLRWVADARKAAEDSSEHHEDTAA